MTHFESIDLRQDRAAAAYIKEETVQVTFAAAAGSLASREGVNRYRAGDALVTGTGGERWSVSRDRFERRYRPLPPLRHGDDGAYRAAPLPVLARQINDDFTVRRSAAGDLLRGSAHDWLLQYAPGDFGLVEDAKFRRLYRPA